MASEGGFAERAKAILESGFIDMSERKLCESKARLDGKVVVITGANTGIGKVTALEVSKRGAKTYIGCRNLEKAQQAIDDIKKVNPEADVTATSTRLIFV